MKTKLTVTDKTEILLAIMAGDISVERAAADYGVEPAQIEEWRRLYVAGLRQSGVTRRKSSGAWRLRRAGLVLSSALVLLFAADASSETPAGCDDFDPQNLELCQFSAGEPAVANEVNSNFSKLHDWMQMPVGTILMYDGTGLAEVGIRTDKVGAHVADTIDFTLYGDWYVCNGLADTPDLRDRFIQGAEQSGTVGGSAAAHRHHVGYIGTSYHQYDWSAAPSIWFHSETNEWLQYIGWMKVGDCSSGSNNDDTWKVMASGNIYSDYEEGGYQPPPFYSVIFIIRKS